MIFWEILLAALSREGIWTGWTMGRHRKITPKMSPLFFKSFRSLWWNCRGGNLMPRKNISAYLPFTYWHKRVTRKCHLYEHVLDILYSPLQVHSPAFSILFGGSGVYCNTDCIAWTLWSFWFGQKHQEEIKGQKEREVFFFLPAGPGTDNGCPLFPSRGPVLHLQVSPGSANYFLPLHLFPMTASCGCLTIP